MRGVGRREEEAHIVNQIGQRRCAEALMGFISPARVTGEAEGEEDEDDERGEDTDDDDY